MKRYLPLIFLAACAVPDAAPIVGKPVPSGIDDTCGATAHASVVGQDATALEKVLILGQVRVIRPGSVVTQDYVPERINFHVGSDNVLDQIICG